MSDFPSSTSPHSHRPLFTADVVAAERDRCEVRLRGELDLSTVAELHRCLDRLRAERHRVIVLDLAELRLLSCAALTMLVDIQHSLCSSGARLVLRSPTPMVQRVLQLTGLTAVLPSQDTPTGPDPIMPEPVDGRRGGDGYRPRPPCATRTATGDSGSNNRVDPAVMSERREG